MIYLEEIRKRIIEIEKKVNAPSFKKDDVRKAFFELQYGVTNSFYIGCVFYECFISKGYLEKINDNTINIYLEDIKTFNFKNYLSLLNGSLIIRAWSNFELCISEVCKKVLSTEENNKLMSKSYDAVLNILKNVEIDDSIKSKLKKNLFENYHVPVLFKFNKLYTKADSSSYNLVDKEKDEKILIFFGKFRNSVHSNFLYSGNPFEIEIEVGNMKYNIRMEDNKRIYYSPSLDKSTSVILFMELVLQLTLIFQRLINSINFPEEIPYPMGLDPRIFNNVPISYRPL